MEVLFFLKRRTQFIRQFYETAGQPFRETQHKIDSGEVPFEPDSFHFDESGEPPFLEEWIQAEISLEILGRTCISMLSASLKLYFQQWEDELGIKWEKGEKGRYFKKGFVRGYQRRFGELLKLKWEDCPVDFDFLEQISLVRNNDQHPDDITTMQVRHKPEDTTKFPSLLFMRGYQRGMYYERLKYSSEILESSWFQPELNVSCEQLLTAIKQVELLGDWLEDRMFAAKYPRSSTPS